MKPMVLADIASAVEMHESTISRVTTQKFLHSPRGIFELKYFFSSHVSTDSGGEASSTAIRALVKKLIAAENPVKPLSDSKLATLLSDREFITSKLAKLEQYFDRINQVYVVLSVEKVQKVAEATLHVNGGELHATSEHQDMYAAIDGLVDKLARQLNKHKDKLKQH
jgi:ribosomal subunit interface protein